MTRIYSEQPVSSPGVWNRMEYRPLEGFVFAVSPFNFTAIGGNLTSSPALMGNVVLWKPASTAMLSAYYVMRLFQEAGLPDGVINLLPGSGATIGDVALASRDLAGIHFTGSTGVFNGMWQTVGADVGRYRNYPRIVGETGGKDFIVAHPSADLDALAAAIVRGSFEYQGQKCSAASRVYAPSNLWPELRERLEAEVASIRMGDVADFSNFMGAVIDSAAFETQREAIEEARAHAQTEVVVGGGVDDERGFFVEPTVIETRDPDFRLLRDELFGPVVTTYVYDEGDWDETLDLIDRTAPYGLTGAVFSEDRGAIQEAKDRLRYAAGNFYVNDKPTGAVVGQQPFGGSRASGTNDKAGSMWNLIRWVTPRTVKETFIPARDYRYPFLGLSDSTRRGRHALGWAIPSARARGASLERGGTHRKGTYDSQGHAGPLTALRGAGGSRRGGGGCCTALCTRRRQADQEGRGDALRRRRQRRSARSKLEQERDVVELKAKFDVAPGRLPRLPRPHDRQLHRRPRSPPRAGTSTRPPPSTARTPATCPSCS